MTSIEQIKERLNIVDVVSSYIKVEKAGVNYKAKCPFHNEKTPSFFISPTRQSFYCFGCQAKGDIFSFVEKIEGLDFAGALKNLADRAGIKLKDWGKENGNKKEKLYQLMETLTSFFEKELEKNKEAISYLKKRGMKENTISKWRIGFALPEWRLAHDFLLQKGFNRKEMLDCGVIKKTPTDKFYDTFRGRIMFPIFDSVGRVIAFSGRILIDDQKSPKYLNSPETELFKKSEILYGWNFAKEHIRKLNYAVLVEGQMDVCLAHQSGTKNIVASSGTSLTLAHLEKIIRMTKRIMIAYDSDEAGRFAAGRAGTMALGLDMEVKITVLPEGEDPASVASKSPEKWKDFLKSSIDLVDYSIKEAVNKGIKSAARLAKEIKTSVIPLIAAVENEILKSQYVTLLSKKANIEEKSVWDEIRKVKNICLKDKEIKQEELPSEEYTLTGIVLWQESLSHSNIDLVILREKIKSMTGLSVEEIADEKNLDKIIFETELKFNGLNIVKVTEEILKRMEKIYLRKELKKIAEVLDSPKTENREILKKKTLEIYKKLSTYENKNGK